MMASRPTPFKQIDVTRAAKGVVAAGLEVERVEVDREGTIIVFPRGSSANKGGVNPCDELLK